MPVGRSVEILYSESALNGSSRHTAAGGTASRERQVIGRDRTFPARLATSGTGQERPVDVSSVTGSYMRIGDIPQKSSRGARPPYDDRGRSGSNNTKQPFGLTGKSLPHSDCCGGIDSS